MNTKLSTLDRRRFLRGTAGFALALPAFETFAETAGAAGSPANPRRLACFYLPNGVPMPLKEDPAYQDWSWFPHGSGKDFTFTKCLDPLEPLRDDLTVISGMSHPGARNSHGHNSAGQFLTGIRTGGRDGYKYSISIDQVYATHVVEQTRFSSLVMSTDGGTGSGKNAHTMSFSADGRPIPAQHKPKRIFDRLFVKDDDDAARRLALSKSVLDHLMEDARSLRRELSKQDQERFEEFLGSVRDTEVKDKDWTIETRMRLATRSCLGLTLRCWRMVRRIMRSPSSTTSSMLWRLTSSSRLSRRLSKARSSILADWRLRSTSPLDLTATNRSTGTSQSGELPRGWALAIRSVRSSMLQAGPRMRPDSSSSYSPAHGAPTTSTTAPTSAIRLPA